MPVIIRIYLVLSVFLLSSCSVNLQRLFSGTEAEIRKDWPRTDFDNRSIEFKEITYQLLPRDGIPAIDNPKFVTPDSITWIKPGEPVIVFEHGEDVRAYPLQIMTHHEIVNDVVNHQPVAITFCPLCNASIVFSRRVEDRVLSFGVSGSLRKSDLVMYDRQTESWWQQFTGLGIAGNYNQVKLQQLASRVVAYQDFVQHFPNGKVLSRETGFSRLYGENPYQGYDDINESPFLFFDPLDKRLRPMERVLAVTYNDTHRVYPLSGLNKRSVINDELNGLKLVVFSKQGMLSVLDQEWIEDSRSIPAAVAYQRRHAKQVLSFRTSKQLIFDEQTGSQWNILGFAIKGPLKGTQLEPVDRGVHFAFAWFAFQPDSEIYQIR